MSFIITIHGEEGIVMAADSRGTYSITKKEGDRLVQTQGIHSTDTMDKVFVCPNGAGIAFCQDSSVNGRPLSRILQEFIEEQVKEDTLVSAMPQLLLDVMEKLSSVPNTLFHIAGYEKRDNAYSCHCYRLMVATREILPVKTDVAGASWDGESDTMTRLFGAMIFHDQTGKMKEIHPPRIPWDLFTLQDMVDFASYAVETTRKTMSFQMRPKTVGGVTDILLIEPKGSTWIQKKKVKVHSYEEQ